MSTKYIVLIVAVVVIVVIGFGLCMYKKKKSRSEQTITITHLRRVDEPTAQTKKVQETNLQEPVSTLGTNNIAPLQYEYKSPTALQFHEYEPPSFDDVMANNDLYQIPYNYKFGIQGDD